MPSCIDLTQSFAGLTHHKPFILTEEKSARIVAAEVRSGPHHMAEKAVYSLEHRLQLGLPEYPWLLVLLLSTPQSSRLRLQPKDSSLQSVPHKRQHKSGK